jgi:hypothetical protein
VVADPGTRLVKNVPEGAGDFWETVAVGALEPIGVAALRAVCTREVVAHDDEMI